MSRVALPVDPIYLSVAEDPTISTQGWQALRRCSAICACRQTIRHALRRRHRRKVFRLCPEKDAQELTATVRQLCGWVRMPFRKPILRGFGCPKGVQVGSGFSEVQAAFVTSLAGNLGVD